MDKCQVIHRLSRLLAITTKQSDRNAHHHHKHQHTKIDQAVTNLFSHKPMLPLLLEEFADGVIAMDAADGIG